MGLREHAALDALRYLCPLPTQRPWLTITNSIHRPNVVRRRSEWRLIFTVTIRLRSCSTELLAKLCSRPGRWVNNELALIHGHGRNRGIIPGLVNINTGYLGLCIRPASRHDRSLRGWIKHTTLDCRGMGCTSIRARANPNRKREQLACL